MRFLKLIVLATGLMAIFAASGYATDYDRRVGNTAPTDLPGQFVVMSKTIDLADVMPATAGNQTLAQNDTIKMFAVPKNATVMSVSVVADEATTNVVVFHVGDADDADGYIASFDASTAANLGSSGAGRIDRMQFNYWDEDVAANQTAAEWGLEPAINVGGVRKHVAMAYPGSVTGIVAFSNEAVTSLTLTADATINGTATGPQAVLDTTNTTLKQTVQAIGLDPFVATDRIGVKVTVPTGFTPTTADVMIGVIVEMNDGASSFAGGKHYTATNYIVLKAIGAAVAAGELTVHMVAYCP